jgi:hypothetical protein
MPRRKACAPCSKAKRRCNQKYPCSRCTRLAVPCQYTVVQQQESIDISAGNLFSNQNGALGGPDAPFLQLEYEADNDGIDLAFLDDPWNLELDPVIDQPGFDNSNDIQLDVPDTLYPMGRQSCDGTVSAEVYDEAVPRMDYVSKVFQAAPSQMVLENGLPWSHPVLYKNRMPRSMQGT